MIKFKDKAYHYAFALLLLTFPFSKALPNIIIAFLAILFIADCKTVNFKRLLQGPIMVLYSLLIYLFIKAAINHSLFTEFTIYKKFLLLFIMPVLFLKINNVVFIKTALVLSVNATVIVSLGMAFSYYLQFGSLPFAAGEMVNRLMVLERPYAGYYALAGCMLAFKLVPLLPRYKLLLAASMVLCVGFIVFVAARMSFLSLLIILSVYIAFYAKIAPKIIFAVAVCSIISLVVLFMVNKNISERFFINESLETASNYEPRIVIWDCAYHMAAQSDFNMLTGFPSDKVIEDNYVACYAQKITNPSKRQWFIETRFNSHNQFNDFFLAHGLPGLGLLAGFMGYLIWYVKNSFTYTAIALGLLLFLVVENVLHRQIGCYIFSIFAALLSITKNQVNDKN